MKLTLEELGLTYFELGFKYANEISEIRDIEDKFLYYLDKPCELKKGLRLFLIFR